MSGPRAFTIRELIAVLAVVVVLFCLAAVALRSMWKTARDGVEGLQIRDIQRAMALWSQNNNDSYPLPSLHDAAGHTVSAGDPALKDTTANIYSILIYNGYRSPEVFVSLLETNPNIRACESYAFSTPPAAANPKLALWDPAFSVDFTDGKAGHASYAHQLPKWTDPTTGTFDRHPRWSSMMQSNEPIVANRGPQVASISAAGVPTLANPSSRTLGWYGPRGVWQGQVVYNDNHAALETSLAPAGVQFESLTAAAKRPDILFHDEADAKNKLNAFLGMFPSAGPTLDDFKAIWD